MIRVAIIGAGIGAEHLKGYLCLPDRFEVRTLCDLDTDRARTVADGVPGLVVTNDMAVVLQDPGIDLVDICLPPHLHLPASRDALDAGKHVICEKPLARSLREVDALEAAVTRSGKRLFPVFQYRYGPAMAQLRALVDANLTGTALVASLETHWNRGPDYYAVPWRGTWAGEAGGAILGHAIHSHDLLCHILGPVAEVHAFADTRANDIETEDCAALSMRMASGALATSSVTLGAATDESRLKFCFGNLTAESDTLPYNPAEGAWRFRARGALTQDAVNSMITAVPPSQVGFAGFLDAVADALAGDEGAAVTLSDGRRSIEFVTAVYQSLSQGGPVSLPLAQEMPFYDGWAPGG